jgi:hypothetical protein
MRVGFQKLVKRFSITLLAAIFVLAVAVVVARYTGSAPSTESVAERFNEKKADYEQLRDMLAEDKNLRVIAPWGVRIANVPLSQAPPIADLSLDRYQEYLARLSGTGAGGIARSDGDDPNICILVWASGWAGDIVHISACWLAHGAPAPTPGAPAKFSYSSLGGQWYERRDF